MTNLTGKTAMPNRYRTYEPESSRDSVFIITVPDPTLDDVGDICGFSTEAGPVVFAGVQVGIALADMVGAAPLDAAFALIGITALFVESLEMMPFFTHDEVIEARVRVQQKLNEAIMATDAIPGWNVIDARGLFFDHGYCAGDHWFNRWQDSIAVQGVLSVDGNPNVGEAIGASISGTMHPNNRGHREGIMPPIRDALLAEFYPDGNIENPRKPELFWIVDLPGLEQPSFPESPQTTCALPALAVLFLAYFASHVVRRSS